MHSFMRHLDLDPIVRCINPIIVEEGSNVAEEEFRRPEGELRPELSHEESQLSSFEQLSLGEPSRPLIRSLDGATAGGRNETLYEYIDEEIDENSAEGMIQTVKGVDHVAWDVSNTEQQESSQAWEIEHAEESRRVRALGGLTKGGHQLLGFPRQTPRSNQRANKTIDAVLAQAAAQHKTNIAKQGGNTLGLIEGLPTDVLLRIASYMDTHPLCDWFVVKGFREKTGMSGSETEPETTPEPKPNLNNVCLNRTLLRRCQRDTESHSMSGHPIRVRDG